LSFEIVQTVTLAAGAERALPIERHLAVGHQQALGDVEVIIGAGKAG